MSDRPGSARILVTTAAGGGAVPASDLRPRDLHRTLPGYAVTPLHDLAGLAGRLGIGGLWVKDESWRLELPSFKILGGSWAVHRLVLQRAGRPVAGAGLAELRAAAAEVGPLTLTTATDGNHGRGVARMAALLGWDAVVYVPEGTAPARIAAIEGEGATVVVHPGNYDAAVARAGADAAEHDRVVIADVATGDDVEVPTWVMDGYDTIFDEADEQLPAPPTTVFLQAGVGALTAAGIRHYVRAGAVGVPRPRFATVEPVSAACLLASAEAGEAVTIDAGQESIMAGLNCGTPSSVAWPSIVTNVTAYLAVPDTRAREAMRLLADAGIVSGESGAAGLAGLLEALAHEHTRDALALDGGSRVLLLNTEGATDPAAYRQIVGRTQEDVRAQEATP
ncbi:MAG TPA: diaminopropionate ammonia-lyase [Egicoccus sp.]|nr:diaminopropionate ammonia-lyase [Egicoccus sp.]HSK22136.1 diaminopropionate ammonia-lyase [Egicoccus sp.]